MTNVYATTEEQPFPDIPPAQPVSRDSFVPERRVVEGAGTQMASEIRWLLQQRLRAAALVLVVGFTLFFLRSLLLHRFESVTVVFHGLMLALLVLSLAVLSSRWKPSLAQLRAFEVALFALILAFFTTAQYALTLRSVRADDPLHLLSVVKGNLLGMLAMMFTYAIFIPNNWRRAAAMIAPMALAPMAVPWILGHLHPEFYEVAVRVANLEQISEQALFLFLGAFTAIFGTHTINTLRSEVYEARLSNQYHLGRKLGVGGMGEVFFAEHQLLKRPCAIKLIRQELVGNPRILARFEREVRATAALSHWNTIEIYDYGRNDDGSFYYVMEYLPGLSLAELVHRHGPMEPARVIYLLRQACDALREAHHSGLVHRDIKPANLMAAYRGGHYDVVKLLDFGLVKTLSEDQSVHLSQEGTVAGSPLYMAPEQIMNTSPADARSDIYGLGAVAYFMLTARPPFTGANAMAVMIAHTRDPVKPPSEIKPDIPSDLEEVVLRCLAKNPGDRYPDTSQLSAALAACADAANWSPQHAAAWWRTHGETARAAARPPRQPECDPPPEETLIPTDRVGIPPCDAVLSADPRQNAGGHSAPAARPSL
jgi:tRNA A-37 threonylcarbamoyl transferase component Bud32